MSVSQVFDPLVLEANMVDYVPSEITTLEVLHDGEAGNFKLKVKPKRQRCSKN